MWAISGTKHSVPALRPQAKLSGLFTQLSLHTENGSPGSLAPIPRGGESCGSFTGPRIYQLLATPADCQLWDGWDAY